MREVIEKGEPTGDVSGVVILQADRCRADSDPGGLSQYPGEEDLGHRDVFVCRRMVFADPEIVESQFLALDRQLQVLVETLGQWLVRVVDRHHEHSQSQALSGHQSGNPVVGVAWVGTARETGAGAGNTGSITGRDGKCESGENGESR